MLSYKASCRVARIAQTSCNQACVNLCMLLLELCCIIGSLVCAMCSGSESCLDDGHYELDAVAYSL
jgi:hypothetical protein